MCRVVSRIPTPIGRPAKNLKKKNNYIELRHDYQCLHPEISLTRYSSQEPHPHFLSDSAAIFARSAGSARAAHLAA
jgi:hypothetical protein